MRQPLLRSTDPTTTTAWIPPVLAPGVVVVLVHAARGDGRAAGAGVLAGAAWGLVLAACLAALVVIASRLRPDRTALGRTGAAASLLLVLTAVSQSLPPVLAGLASWQGKLIDLAWLVVLFLVLRDWARNEAGIRLRLEPGSARPAWVVIGTVFAVFLALTVLSVAAGWLPAVTVTAEQLAYDATIPNLTEELLWRGALLAVLDRVLGTPVTVAGASVGWGVVVSAVVFGLGHGLVLTEDWTWSVNVAGGLFSAAMGLALGWLRAGTGSVWPAFVLHCAPELGVDLGLLLAG